mmetsp:Transcript_7269/g.13157  ORF Transcript_7269/g.13157 Transcript_7269/m.13157 type:complete len:240 (-) Transcript_7269:77-796(-)
MAVTIENAEDLTSRSWKNQGWLDTYPLDARSVLSYFAESIFYDPNCNNEIARKHFMDPTRIANLPPGVEYVVTESQEPHLFVICKQKRSLVEVTAQVYYYILDGVVYQAPTLHQVLSSRMSRCKWNIRQALTKMKQHLDPLMQVKNQERAAGDGAVEGAAAAAEVVKQRPLSREEQEHAMKIDNIIANVLRKDVQKAAAAASVKGEGGGGQPAATAANGTTQKRAAMEGEDPANKRART